MSTLWIICFICGMVLVTLAVVSLVGWWCRRSNPSYHEFKQGILHVYIFEMSRNKNGGSYTKISFKKDENGEFVRYLSEEEKNENRKERRILVMGMMMSTLCIGGLSWNAIGEKIWSFLATFVLFTLLFFYFKKKTENEAKRYIRWNHIN